MEIALRVHEPDTNEGEPDVARFLAMVAGQHAKPACINRQRLMKGELGRKVGDRTVGQIGDLLGPPRAHGHASPIQILNRCIVKREKRSVLRCLLDPFAGNEPQHADRVVRG